MGAKQKGDFLTIATFATAYPSTSKATFDGLSCGCCERKRWSLQESRNNPRHTDPTLNRARMPYQSPPDDEEPPPLSPPHDDPELDEPLSHDEPELDELPPHDDLELDE